MFCEKCGANIPENISCCPKCGKATNINLDKFCRKCGAEIKPGSDFCEKCGTVTEATKQKTENKNSTITTLGALGFIMPWIGIFVALASMKENPEAARVGIIASICGFLLEASVILPSIVSYWI